MAKVKSNDIIAGLSGKLGKQLVIRHMKDGRTIVLTRPDFSNRVFSPEQLTHQSRFQQAAAYARWAAKTEPRYAELAKGTSKNAYNLALSDWFNPPVIHEVSSQNGRILVNATDNVQVAKVRITVFDQAGQLVEQGEAGASHKHLPLKRSCSHIFCAFECFRKRQVCSKETKNARLLAGVLLESIFTL